MHTLKNLPTPRPIDLIKELCQRPMEISMIRSFGRRAAPRDDRPKRTLVFALANSPMHSKPL